MINFSGFENAVSLIKNVKGGELIVIGSRPSLGKTWLALNIIKEMVLIEKLPSCFFSIEMSKEKINERISKINMDINSNLLEIIDDTAIEINKLRSIIENKKKESNTKLFVIDYLGLLWNESKENMNKLIETLKSIAVELSVTIIGLTALPRESTGIKPKIEHFNIPGNNVDLIIGLYKENEKSETEILVLQNKIE